jgi:APA family basic amino acid/polyamine antiporter
MAEEARDESITVPKAIMRVVVAVFVIYAALPLVALSALPVHRLANGHYVTLLGLGQSHGGFAGDPVLGIVKHLHLGPLQQAGELYVGLLAATILLIATHAGIIGVSRLVYSMGLHRQVPDQLRQLHPRFRTPWIGILLFGAVACLTLIPGRATFLGNVYAFGAMLSFTIAHLAVIKLRLKEPAHERPYRGPGTLRLGRRELPLFAVLGGLGTGLAFVTVTALHAEVALAGVGWLAVGILAYTLYRRNQGLDLFATFRVATPVPATEHDIEYESILLVYEHAEFSADVMRIAIKLAARNRRSIHVLVFIEVPAALPIDAAMPEQEQAAQAIIEAVKIRGRRRVHGHWEKVRAGQAGRRIIDEARIRGARAIIMPTPPPRRGNVVFGPTIEAVLKNRPCRVIIESTPVSKVRLAA